jgi:hypothetical protein|tara:strand:- start:3258 stop:3488 length:231 start_codon:yes stop_codon:yes gene_type:complete
MRISDLIEDRALEEGPMWDKVKGFFKGKPKDTTAVKSSPFDSIPRRDAKNMLGKIINGKPLESNEIRLLNQVYNKL